MASRVEPIHPWRWRALAIILLVYTIAAVLTVQQVRRTQNQGRQAHAALCAFKDDLGKRIADSTRSLETARQFLHDHPHGIPGIPASLLRQSVQNQQTTVMNQQATLASLSSLRC